MYNTFSIDRIYMKVIIKIIIFYYTRNMTMANTYVDTMLQHPQMPEDFSQAYRLIAGPALMNQLDPENASVYQSPEVIADICKRIQNDFDDLNTPIEGAEGVSPFPLAAAVIHDGNHPDIIVNLLENGADPNRSNAYDSNDEETMPLMLALHNALLQAAIGSESAFEQEFSILKTLILHGAHAPEDAYTNMINLFSDHREEISNNFTAEPAAPELFQKRVDMIKNVYQQHNN